MKVKKTVRVTITEAWLLSAMVSDPETFARANFQAKLIALLGEPPQVRPIWDCEVLVPVNLNGGFTRTLQRRMPRAATAWLTLRNIYQEYKYLVDVNDEKVAGCTFHVYLSIRNGNKGFLVSNIAAHLARERKMDGLSLQTIVSLARASELI